jgi:hypothetical protein
VWRGDFSWFEYLGPRGLGHLVGGLGFYFSKFLLGGFKVRVSFFLPIFLFI